MQQPRSALLVLALTAAAVQACAPKEPPPAAPRAPTYQTDLVGKAASCTTSELKTVVDGHDNPVSMTTGGGGWCGILLNHNGSPYAAGLLIEPPKNGRAYVHTVGDDTRIDYTPKPGTVNADNFAVRLIPGDAVIRVAVNTPATPAGKSP